MITLRQQPVSSVVAPLPTGLTRQAADAWQSLSRVPALGVFDPRRLSGDLPEPMRRWLTHAIVAGTPLAGAARLEMTGEIRLGRRWHRFNATQLLAPGHGYVWAATTRVGGIPVVGFDRYSDGSGDMHWRLGRMLPLMSASGDDLTASAVGRLAGELALLPTAYRTASWMNSPSPDRFIGRMNIDGRLEEVQFHASGTGRLRDVRSQRWGNPLGEPFGRYPFGVVCHGDATFHGITVPTQIVAGWFIGADRWDAGEFYRARITDLAPLG